MDSNMYFKYNRLQKILSKKFCSKLATDSDWCEARLETVMDIGCGPGNTSTYWIDHYFPDIERLIGIDNDPGMIGLANENNSKEKIEFYVADIMDKERLKEWEGRVDRILSLSVFHRVSDQKQAFRNVFDLLTSSGVASLTFIVKGPLYFALTDLLHTQKWKSILETINFQLPVVKGYHTEFYKQMFEDLGFSVPHCELRVVDFSYESDEECKNLLMSIHDIGEVSDDVKEEFKEDLFQQFVKYSPRDSEGRPTHNTTSLHVKLVKDGSRNGKEKQ